MPSEDDSRCQDGSSTVMRSRGGAAGAARSGFATPASASTKTATRARFGAQRTGRSTMRASYASASRTCRPAATRGSGRRPAAPPDEPDVPTAANRLSCRASRRPPRRRPKAASREERSHMDFIFNLPLFVSGPGIILLLVAFALGGLTLYRKYLLPKLRYGHGDSDFSAGMVAAIMVFYGLALALTAVHLWEMHQDVAKITARESACLAALW